MERWKYYYCAKMNCCRCQRGDDEISSIEKALCQLKESYRRRQTFAFRSRVNENAKDTFHKDSIWAFITFTRRFISLAQLLKIITKKKEELTLPQKIVIHDEFATQLSLQSWKGGAMNTINIGTDQSEAIIDLC